MMHQVPANLTPGINVPVYLCDGPLTAVQPTEEEMRYLDQTYESRVLDLIYQCVLALQANEYAARTSFRMAFVTGLRKGSYVMPLPKSYTFTALVSVQGVEIRGQGR